MFSLQLNKMNVVLSVLSDNMLSVNQLFNVYNYIFIYLDS